MGRMAKLMSDVKVTVEIEDVKFIFNAETAGISSVDGGFTHNLTVGRLFNAQKIIIQPKEAPVTAETPAPSPSELTTEQEMALHNVIQTAKLVERTQFSTARAVERVITEGEAAKAVAAHDFSMAVLEGLHAGLPLEAIDKALEDQQFGDLTEKTKYVASLDMSMLYQTEA